MNGRIPCLNPACRRTVPADKHEDAEEVICGKCFKALPDNLRKRYRRLTRWNTKLGRLVNSKRGENISEERCQRMNRQLTRLFYQNWDKIRNYYQAPVKPAGLETFLQEMGLDE